MKFIRKLIRSDSLCPVRPVPEGQLEQKITADSIDITHSDPPSEKPVFDPGDKGYIQDPYPLFSTLRQHFPVFRAPSGAWVISRYEDVSAGLVDKRLGNAPSPYAVLHERNSEKYICADVASNIIPFMDPPRHNHPRRMIARAFHSHLTQNPPEMKSAALELIRRHEGVNDMEIVSDLGTPFSIGVLCELLGLPLEDQPQLKAWTEKFFYLFAPMPSEAIRDEVDKALNEFREYLSMQVKEKRAHLQDDLICKMMTAEDQGVMLSGQELIDNTMLLFADGVENVDRGLGNMMHTLLAHPQSWAEVKQNPELIPQVVEEALRYESPAQFVGKVALEDIDWRGQVIKQHSGVLLMLASANRDPEKFEQPNTFNIHRNPKDHLAFGRGRHSCVGAHLVKLQLQSALEALVESVPDMQLSHSSVTWEPRLAHRWISSVRVRLTPEENI
ncbi:MAG: cytochrome P450 [Verrucomicrobiota bacterium]